MKILLTNDDGYDAINIKAIYEKLSEEHEVWIVAPKSNCSGMSAAISYLNEIEVKKIFLLMVHQLIVHILGY